MNADNNAGWSAHDTQWRSVTKASPCPICNKGNWCRIASTEDVVACRRVSEGAFKKKADKNGTTFYLYRINGSQAKPQPCIPVIVPSSPAGSDLRHDVYSSLLSSLTLSSRHRQALLARGLSESQIDALGYKTLSVQGRPQIAQRLLDRFGKDLLGVPGFVIKERDGRRFHTVAGAAGIVVPVRDGSGNIVALKVRSDDVTADNSKYTYISSARFGGPGPGSPVHIPLGIRAPADLIRLTEGELKADVATLLSGVPTISIPGVTNWRPALTVLLGLGARTIRLALDGDYVEKPVVARALSECANALTSAGFAIELEQWPTEHKGIDDALVAKAPIDVLTDTQAVEVIREIAGASDVSIDGPEETLTRLPRVLAEGGGAALFRDKELLTALAKLSVDNCPEFAAIKGALQAHGVSVSDLKRVLKPLAHEHQAAKPIVTPPDKYSIVGGCIQRTKETADGPVTIPLCNFNAKIVEQITRDDGADQAVEFAIEGQFPNGLQTQRILVRADEFARLDWPVREWGTQAIVYAGMGVKDHLRVAIQMLSGNVPRRTIYGHTGWRLIHGEWVFLHGGGAIGRDGRVSGIEVSLPDSINSVVLPDPVVGKELVVAIRASMKMLDIAPLRVTLPVFASIWRAPLGPCDFSIYVAGGTGLGKSETAVLAQQHFGPKLDARNIPGSWSSTGNALEALSFVAKDIVLVVDDFAPGGSHHDVQKTHREADRLLRAQGNRAGRSRLKADATLRPAKYPRGIIISTGEDVPRGHSLRSRQFINEFSPGDMNWGLLTQCQRDAAEGTYAKVTSSFIKWLAPKYAELQTQLRELVTDQRDKASHSGTHKRTPEIVANLLIGVRYFLDFALNAGALTESEAAALHSKWQTVLMGVAADQSKHHQSAEPTQLFLDVLKGALASGRAHVANREGGSPYVSPEGWGWRNASNGGDEWKPQGDRIGWVDGDDLYIEPQASYTAVQGVGQHTGQAIPIGILTLKRRLKENGHLVSTDISRETITVRRVLESQRREVLHLRASLLFEKPDQPDISTTAGSNPHTVPGSASWDVDQSAAIPTQPIHAAATTYPEMVGMVGSLPSATPDHEKGVRVLLSSGREVQIPHLGEAPTDAIAWTQEEQGQWYQLPGD
jgi:hypothetical protein